MNVFSLLVVLGCSFIAASGQLTANALNGCSPDCRGQCFAGTCLFAENNVDDAEAFRSSQFQQPAATMPMALPQVAPSLPSWASGLMAHPEQPQTFMPPATATAGLPFQSVSVLENKAQELSFELQRAEAHEALLRAQNAKLEQQLEDWKTTGANIAQRESKVMNILESAPNATAAAPTAPLAAAVPAQRLSFLQAARQRWSQSTFIHTYFGSFVTTMVLLFLVVSAWKTGRFIQQYRKGEVNLQTMSQALASSQRLHPVARAMGLVQYKVEVSEIHLGSLFAGSNDVRVNFRMGNGVERRTKALKNAGGTFLRFDDVLELSICGSDSPCVICVTDRRGDLAHVELASSHLLRLATRPHQEYFRTELTASRELGVTDGRRPYVAMRMRNVTAPPTVPAVPTAGTGNVKSEQRVYGSFAV